MPILLFLLPLMASARVLSPHAGINHFQSTPEYQAVLNQVKALGGFKEKTKGQGERLVEEAKARNRTILAKQYETDKKKRIRPIDTRMVSEQWKEEVARTHENWKREVQETHKRWQREQEIFLGRLKEYQETTFEIPAPKIKIKEVEVPRERLPEVHIVRGAFDVPIRDQRRRPTCAAFAGVRAMEILLAQNSVQKQLSPQYFYWASKPKCQSAPCSEKGSWVTPGLRYSQNLQQLDIPLEENCPYTSEVQTGNETQLPLKAGCKTGAVKVEGFEEPRTLAQTVEKLKQNIPVIMAAKLSWNFYKNQGLVTLEDSKKPSPLQMDFHSMGHALLAIGVMELPQKVHEKEGNYCILVANSWGKGWGAGGYACLTEKWLQKYRQSSPFVAVTKIRVN